MLLKLWLHQNQMVTMLICNIHCYVLKNSRVVYMKKMQDTLKPLLQVLFWGSFCYIGKLKLINLIQNMQF